MLPKILVIDDLFGRRVPNAINVDRRNLCSHLLLRDITDPADRRIASIGDPIAEAVFCRGQRPIEASVGDTVENDLRQCLSAVHSGWVGPLATGDLPWAFVLLDLCFYTGRVTERSNAATPGMPEGCPDDADPESYFGLQILAAITAEFPELPVLILSSKPREDVSREFSRLGALGFIARDEMRAAQLLEDALWQHGLLPDQQQQLIGNSLPMLLALREARRAGNHRQNLLIRGERGSGKELLAGYIHRVSTQYRSAPKSPFVTVNSAVLTTSLFSELFGIMAKTATGVDAKLGLIEQANGGDLFLDEIADMPSEIQSAILRVLQDRQVTRIGARQPNTVDVRFLSATNVQVEDARRSFRSDLLDRLRLGGTIFLPALRERLTDMQILAQSFVQEAESARFNAIKREIAPEALDLLNAYHWPGNVRELRTVLFDAVNRHPDVEYLVPVHLRFGGSDREPAVSTPGSSPASGPAPQAAGLQAASRGIGPTAGLDELLTLQSRIKFDAGRVAEWSGRLGDVQASQAWLLARLLEAALQATKRHTTASPQGVVQIHPAVKLLTGDAALSASKAADIIKKLLGPIADEISGDLSTAYSMAVRLRPKSAAKRKPHNRT